VGGTAGDFMTPTCLCRLLFNYDFVVFDATPPTPFCRPVQAYTHRTDTGFFAYSLIIIVVIIRIIIISFLFFGIIDGMRSKSCAGGVRLFPAVPDIHVPVYTM